MEIQQQEKESLTAYLHQFKTEAKRCNFTNDAATIRIFIKGLKNAHNLATCIYEKGPQILRNAISKVEKLNAVQQLNATITPPSTVNMMSIDEDRCVQCQEHGHIARNCPTLGVSNVISMVTLLWIGLTGFLLQEPQQRITNPNYTKVTRPGQAPGKAIPGLSHTFTDTAAQVVMMHIEAIVGHNIGIIATITAVVYDAQIPQMGVIATNPAVTHHIDQTVEHPHTEAHDTIPEIEVTHIHIHPTNHQDKIHIGCTHTPVDMKQTTSQEECQSEDR